MPVEFAGRMPEPTKEFAKEVSKLMIKLMAVVHLPTDSAIQGNDRHTKCCSSN